MNGPRVQQQVDKTTCWPRQTMTFNNDAPANDRTAAHAPPQRRRLPIFDHHHRGRLSLFRARGMMPAAGPNRPAQGRASKHACGDLSLSCLVVSWPRGEGRRGTAFATLTGGRAGRGEGSTSSISLCSRATHTRVFCVSGMVTELVEPKRSNRTDPLSD